MSVINKMLRDLDDRKASGTLQVRLQDGTEGIARDTQSIREGKRPQTGSGAGGSAGSNALPWSAVLLVLVVLAGAMAWWWWHDMRPPAGPPIPQQPVVAESVPPVIAPAPAAPGASVPKGQAKALPGRSPSETQTSPVASKAPEPPQPDASKTAIPAVVPRNLASPPLPAPEPSLKMDSLVRPGSGGGTAPAPASPAPQVAAPAAPAPLPSPQLAPPPAPRPSPVMEALAQAQSLWAAGSRVGAVELLKDAIAVAERSPGTGGATLAALARELGRMELAEGRAAAALEMLTRLEPSLTGVADIWALRGNAAQRLGRHEESSNAYLTALKLKPGEPRWMLGAAVSLAAQGQTGLAADWAEQARAAGALSREVASYLQQLGVPLRER